MKPFQIRPILVAMVATILAAMTFAGCGGATNNGGSTQATTLTVYASGDVNVQHLWQNTLIPGFEKANPNIKVKLIFAEHGTIDQTTLARMSAAVAAHKEPGMDLIESGIITQAATANLLQEVTPQQVPLMNRVDPALLQQVNNMAVPYRASCVVLAYNSQYVSNPPKNLKDLVAWIHAHPGKFTYNSPSSGGSGQAFVREMLNTHISASDMKTFITGYDTSLESQWKPGFDDLRTLNKDIYRNGLYPNGNAAVLQLLGNGSIWVAPVWSDMAISYQEQHLLPDAVKLTQLDPPFSGGPAYLAVPRNAPHAKEAFKLMNWILGSDVQATVIKEMNGFPGVQWSYVPKDVQEKFADIARSYSQGYSAKFNADVNKQWQAQVAGG
ncbi:extracellular solute-binding protein [Ktedonosporobacter rubrisoli]|nr:extracellular solute-binding protein [Ktedonosporobacter rubrisoli]